MEGGETVGERILERFRLFNLVRNALQRRVVCIAAPAGYGKTTFIRDWLRFEPQTHKTIWLTIAPEDDNPVAFCRKLCDALGKAHAAMPRMPASFSGAPMAYTLSALKDIAQHERFEVPPRRFLVVDDAHLLTHGELLRSLPGLFQNLPEGSHTILIGRGGPLCRHMTDVFGAERIGTSSLRFSSPEIARCFELHGRKLTRPAAARVLKHTAGWPIVVALLAEGGTLPSASNREKLLEKSLRKTFWSAFDPLTRDFLLRTCIVDELTPALCAQLTGRLDAGEVLEEISSSSLLTPLWGSESGTPAYVHHDLFLDFLRTNLKERHDIDRATLHETAAEHYFDSDDAYRAIRHALLSGSPAIVTRAMHEAMH